MHEVEADEVCRKVVHFSPLRKRKKILPLRVAPRKRDLGRIKDTVLRSAIGEYFQTSVSAIASISSAYRVCTYILRPSALFFWQYAPPQQPKLPKGNTSQ